MLRIGDAWPFKVTVQECCMQKAVAAVVVVCLGVLLVGWLAKTIGNNDTRTEGYLLSALAVCRLVVALVATKTWCAISETSLDARHREGVLKQQQRLRDVGMSVG